MRDLAPRPGDLDPIETASLDEPAGAARAAAVVGAARLRARAALPAQPRRRRRAPRRRPRA
nr:hypothetical protein [Angustibacter aerolatus]